MGQSGLKGRHPIYFNRVGSASKSYIKNSVIREAYNRGVVLASTDNLRVEGNDVYDVKGHAYSLEDGTEQNNVFHDNYAVKVQKHFHFMTTDAMPAGFYITNPNNVFTDNVVHSSDKFGFWYHLASQVKGASQDDTMCPSGMPLSKFEGNKAISNGFYGLRIFNQYHPRTNPCEATHFDPSIEEGSPYGENAPVCAVFEDFECIRNGRSCVVSEAKGCVS